MTESRTVAVSTIAANGLCLRCRFLPYGDEAKFHFSSFPFEVRSGRTPLAFDHPSSRVDFARGEFLRIHARQRSWTSGSTRPEVAHRPRPSRA
jgi:hypothetical protein